MKIEDVLENIKTKRKERGFSHEHFADLLNMSQTSYTKLENNVSKLSVERLIEISKVLDTSIDKLLGLDFIKVTSKNSII